MSGWSPPRSTPKLGTQTEGSAPSWERAQGEGWEVYFQVCQEEKAGLFCVDPTHKPFPRLLFLQHVPSLQLPQGQAKNAKPEAKCFLPHPSPTSLPGSEWGPLSRPGFRRQVEKGVCVCGCIVAGTEARAAGDRQERLEGKKEVGGDGGLLNEIRGRDKNLSAPGIAGGVGAESPPFQESFKTRACTPQAKLPIGNATNPNGVTTPAQNTVQRTHRTYKKRPDNSEKSSASGHNRGQRLVPPF